MVAKSLGGVCTPRVLLVHAIFVVFSFSQMHSQPDHVTDDPLDPRSSDIHTVPASPNLHFEHHIIG